MKFAFVLSLLVLTSTAFSAPIDKRQDKASPVRSGVEAWKLGLLGLAAMSFLIRKRL